MYIKVKSTLLLIIINSLLFLAIFFGSISFAGTLSIFERQITSSTEFETFPRLARDNISPYVTYTSRTLLGNGFFDQGDIWYQRLNEDGSLIGTPVQITVDQVADEQLNDGYGDYIVYTAYNNTLSDSGKIMLYQISTGNLSVLGESVVIQEPRIHENIVVWRQGGIYATEVMLYDINNLDTVQLPTHLTGPAPPTYHVDIGSRFVVWAERDGDYDIGAYDMQTGQRFLVTDTADIQERQPSTYGDWIIWQEQDDGVSHTRIVAKNFTTGEVIQPISRDRVLSRLQLPSMAADWFAYEGNNQLNFDVYIHRISTGETYAATMDPADQYLNDVQQHINDPNKTLIAYVDVRSGDEDIWVASSSYLTPNRSPIANAGPDQRVHVGTPVTLNGSNSYDPDNDYPLNYQWELLHQGNSVSYLLSDSTIVNPSFTSEYEGNYVAYLTVTDSKGAVSDEDQIQIDTVDTAPVADAGPDQAINTIGTLVTLDGSGSYDLDGDDIGFAWNLRSPANSFAVLDDITSITPSFIADINGDYSAILIVGDGYKISMSDEVIISFNNIKPIADAGFNQGVFVGDTVDLDGSSSFDANSDILNYRWNYVSLPMGSSTIINNKTNITANFIADVAGTYIVSLVVNDGFIDSDPSNIEIFASINEQQVIKEVNNAITVINDLPPDVFKNTSLRKPLTQKLNAVLNMLNEGNYQEALNKLLVDVLSKTDGCEFGGKPDRNDWITSCEEQSKVYSAVNTIIDLLHQLLDN